jgi:ABC-type multidrug transport system fused ATPase/permease subunit
VSATSAMHSRVQSSITVRTLKRWNAILGLSSLDDFINGVMKVYFEPMDPNVLLDQMHKWQRADVARHTGGDLGAALSRIAANTFVIPISHDQFFPPKECEADCKLISNAELRVILSMEAHMGRNGFEPGYMAQVDRHLSELLNAQSCQNRRPEGGGVHYGKTAKNCSQKRDQTLRHKTGGVLVLDDINLDVGAGEFMSIVGPSGCGKTALPWSMAGLYKLPSGTIALDGQQIAGPHHQIGMMFQEANLLPWRSIQKNIKFPFEIRGQKPDIAKIERF